MLNTLAEILPKYRTTHTAASKQAAHHNRTDSLLVAALVSGRGEGISNMALQVSGSILLYRRRPIPPPHAATAANTRLDNFHTRASGFFYNFLYNLISFTSSGWTALPCVLPFQLAILTLFVVEKTLRVFIQDYCGSRLKENR